MMRIVATALVILLTVYPVLSEVRIDVVPFSALTSAGNQNITGNMSSTTPKGALVFLGGGVTPGIVQTHARLSIGAFDGTNQCFWGAQAEDNQSTTDMDNWAATTAVAAIIDVNRTIMCSMVGTMLTDGINLSQTTGCDQTYKGSAVLWGGEDVSFKVGMFSGPNSLSNSTDVATVGFEPDVVLFGKTKKSLFDDFGDGSFLINLGLSLNHVATSDINVGIAQSSQNNIATSASSMRVQADSLWTTDISNDDGQIILEAYDEAGFSARNQIKALGDEFCFVAIGLPDTLKAYLSIIDTPASANAGIQEYSGPIFKPQFSMLVMTGSDATNTTREIVSAAIDPSVSGIALYDSTDMWSTSVSLEDASASADAKSLVSTSDVRMLTNAGTLGWQATMSHTLTGTNIDFVTNPSTMRKWLYLAIEESFVFDRPFVQPFMGQ